mgnify:FL=1
MRIHNSIMYITFYLINFINKIVISINRYYHSEDTCTLQQTGHPRADTRKHTDTIHVRDHHIIVTVSNLTCQRYQNVKLDYITISAGTTDMSMGDAAEHVTEIINKRVMFSVE